MLISHSPFGLGSDGQPPWERHSPDIVPKLQRTQLKTIQSISSLQIEPSTQSARPAINSRGTFVFSDLFAFGVREAMLSGTAHS